MFLYMTIGVITSVLVSFNSRPKTKVEAIFEGLFCAYFWWIAVAIYAFVKHIENNKNKG